MLLLTLMGGVKLNVLNAQETETVTFEPGSTPIVEAPSWNLYNRSYTQTIYTNENLGGKIGTITAIAYKQYANNGNATNRTIDVYMANTNKNTFSSKTDFVAMTSSDLVYSGKIEFKQNGDWIYITLDKGFEYTGGNLLISVNDKTGTYVGSATQYLAGNVGSNRVLCYYKDPAPDYDPSSPSGTSKMMTTINNMQFVIKSGEQEPTVPAVPVLAAEATGKNSIELSWNSVFSATSYNIYQGSSQIATNITETTFTVENLEMDAEYCFQVSAVNEIGESEKSDEVCTTIKLEFAVEIGADQNPNYSSNLYLPVYDFAKYAISQQIYTKDEIGQEECIINSVSFKVGSGYAATRQYEVYLKNTDQSTFNNSNYIAMSASDKVFDGSVYVGNAETWYTINFTTPFTYTGNNIVICVYDKTGFGAGNPGYHQFYKYSATGRSLYSQGSSAYNATSLTTGNLLTYVNQIKFDAKYITPIVEITPGSIDLGTVRAGGDFWTEKPFDYSNYAVTVKAQGGAYIETNTIQQEDDFFKIVEVSPIPTDGGYYYHISYNQNGTTGDKEGTLVVTYKDSESATEINTATIPLSAVAYSSDTDGEAIENPIEVAFTENAFTHAATGMHDDYILPGEENDGNNGDAVYKFTLENDAVLTANVTGNNPIVAIYNEDFGEKEGPSSDNNYEGVEEDNQEPLAETSFSYNFDNSSLEGWNTIDADGDGKTFGLSVASWLGDYGVGGTKCIESAAANNGSHNNYIVTDQKYGITETSTLTFSVKGTNYSPHKYDVVISTTDNNLASSFTSLCQKTIELKTYTTVTIDVDLREYAGKNVYIGFRHYESSTNTEEKLYIDNIALTDGSAKSRSVAQTRSTNQIDRVLYPAGTYYLVAAAEGNFTLNLSTETLSAPAAATLTAPANEATEQNNPLLTWTLDKFAEKYQLLLGTTNPPTDVVVDWSAPATSYQTEGLANNTVYYWQVKSKNSVGESSSEVFSFVTPLNKPTNVTASKTNLYPGDETTISWTEASGATSYNVYVGENKVASEVTSPYTLSSLEYNVNPGHNVTVTANHTLGESAKSDAVVVKMTAKSTVTFTVKNDAGTPVEGASVRIYNGKDQYGVAIAEQTFTTNADGQVVEDLLYLYGDYTGYYYFEVTKAPYATYNYNSSSDYISSSNFNNPTYAKNITLQLAVPTGLAVESDKLYPGENLVVTWNEIAEADSYKVYVNNIEHGVANTNEYTIEDLEYNVTNNYNNGDFVQVQAVYDGIGESAISSEYKYFKVTGYGSFTATVSVEGATMKLEGTDEFGAPQTYTIDADENGSYALDEVLAGSYTATASAFGYNDATATVTVEYNVDANYEFVMTEKPTAPENLLKDVAVAEEYGAAKVTWTGAYNNTQMYNIYRKNVETGDVELVAENHNGTYSISKSYTDAAYAGLEDGTYQYGVTTMVDADEVILNEGFENGKFPEGWINNQVNYYYNYYGWKLKPSDAYNGSTYCIENNCPYNNYTVSLETSLIDLTSYLSATLSFYYVNKPYGSYGYNTQSTIRIKVKKQGGSWETVETINENVANYNLCEIKLNSYVGNQIQISFECSTSQYAYSRIDDIVLSVGSKTETAPVWSNTIKKGGIVFTNNNGEGDGKWETASNWSNGEVPANDGTAEVTIKAAATISSEVDVKYLAINGGSLTLESTAVLTADELINNDEYTFIIKDGAQLFHNNTGVKASFTMGIVNPEGEGEEVWNENNKTGWQFIASPFTGAAVDDFVPTQGNNYDLYRYAGSADEEWDNHKDNHLDQSWWYFNPGEGYLASYDKLGEATLRGTLNSGVTYSWDNLTYDNSKDLANFHLLGNPFTFDMDIVNATFTNLVEGFAVVTPQGGYDYSQTTIPVGDGFFVKATGENPSLYYNHNASVSVARRGSESNNSLNITATGNAGKDNVVINFAGKSEGFDKLQNFNDAIATVYVAEDGKNYGIYNCDADVQEVELSFNANKMGNYTISIEPNGKFQTVTLVDRFTGVETNMLVEDYNFTAMSEESPNRFIVRMVNGQQTTDNSHFVYQSGEELILNIQGDVQIVDVLGRVVYNGEAMNDINRINVSSFNSGAYMVRVMNGNEVKVEKVVIY